jgi:hypothetical protein
MRTPNLKNPSSNDCSKEERSRWRVKPFPSRTRGGSERWSSRFIAPQCEVSALVNQLSTCGASRVLKMAILFSKTFGTFTDLL